MPFVRLLIAIIGVIGLSGCASQPTASIDYDPSMDFSAWRSWTWPGDKPMTVTGADVGPLTQQHIQSAVERVLGLRGYRLEYDRTRAQFAIRFSIANRASGSAAPPATPSGRSGREGPWTNTAAEVASSSGALLMIDMHDIASGRVVWQGWAPLDIAKSKYGGKMEPVNASVSAILAQFPPGGS